MSPFISGRGRVLCSCAVWAVIVLQVVCANSSEVERPDDDLQLEVTTGVIHGHIIQMGVHWDAADDNARYVDIIVRTWSVGSFCPDTNCQMLGVDQHKGVQLLPEDRPLVEETKECDFRPGCSYNVLLKYEHQDHQTERNVTIPECVENICRCDYPEKFPSFSVALDYDAAGQVLHVGWQIDGETNKLGSLHGFYVRFFKVHSKTSHLRSSFEPHAVRFAHPLISGESASGTEDIPLPGDYFRSELNETSNLKVEVFLIDSKECHSASKFEFLELEEKEETKTAEGSYWIKVVLIIMLVAALLLLMGVATYRFSLVGRHIIAKVFQLPMNYTNINNRANNSMTTSFPMQENHIYVEKELYDAKVRGEVDEYEISPSSLTFGPQIGMGAFGRVFIAQMNDNQGQPVVVAVKRLKNRPSEEEMTEFFTEIKTMKQIGYHENIISLLGCCTLRQPALIVMEYIGKGDLKNYLCALRGQQTSVTETTDTQSSVDSECSTDSDASYILQNEKQLRPSVTEMGSTTSGAENNPEKTAYVLDQQELQGFAIQIANGMTHLEDLGLTHRDLAARNILIDDRKRLKISDFGLSREGVYVSTRMKKMPLRWLSIEAIRRSLYSSKSDVWAFGVVLWEISTLGRFPYEDVENTALLPFLLSGGRLKKPENCSDKLYEVMLTCWHENPMERPSFARLMEIFQEPEQKIYIDLDELYGDNDVFYEAPVVREGQ